MAVPFMAVAYGSVILGGLALVAGGTPGARSAELQARLAADRLATPAYSADLAKRIAAYAATVGPNAPAATAQAAGVTLRSVGFDLPTSDRAFPPGPSADLVAANCQSCHSAGMVLTQPALTAAEWTGEVNKMVRTYKAPVAEGDVPGIVSYLAAMKVAP